MSNIIKGLRVAKGYTQEEMAKALKINQRTYCIKENDPNKFLVSEIRELAKKLEVNEEVFFKEKITFSVS